MRFITHAHVPNAVFLNMCQTERRTRFKRFRLLAMFKFATVANWNRNKGFAFEILGGRGGCYLDHVDLLLKLSDIVPSWPCLKKNDFHFNNVLRKEYSGISNKYFNICSSLTLGFSVVDTSNIFLLENIW